MIYEWDEHKRLINLEKHGLDFNDAKLVYKSLYCYTVEVFTNGENRIAAFAYVFEVLAVLTLVITKRGKRVRCISYRYASDKEKEIYHEWLESEFKE